MYFVTLRPIKLVTAVLYTMHGKMHKITRIQCTVATVTMLHFKS